MAIPKLEDELDNLQVPKKAVTPALEDEDEKASMKASHTTTAATTAAAPTDDDDLSVDFGDRELMKRTGLLERLRPDKGKAVRFAFLTDFVKARSAFTHFIEKKGTFRCLEDKKKRTSKDKGGDPDAEGYCCKKLKEEAERLFIALVLFYKNADPIEGGYAPGTPLDWELRYVQLTIPNFAAISRLIEEEVPDGKGGTRMGTVNDMDVVMVHANKAFGYEFYKKASTPKWRKNPDLVKEVAEKIKPFLDGTKLDGRLGRKVTDLEMKALISTLAPGAEDARLGDVDSL